MRRSGGFFGLSVLVVFCPAVLVAQTGTFYQPFSGVGQLQQVGLVGRSNPDNSFGQVGGVYTGRFQTSPFSVGGVATPSSLADMRGALPNFTGRNGRTPSPLSFRDRKMQILGTQETRRNSTYATRPDLIRAQLPPSVRQSGPYADLPARSRRNRKTPVSILLEQRNLLAPKSPLARYVSQAYQSPYTPVEDADLGIDAAATQDGAEPVAASTADSMNDLISERLARQYERYYQDGLSFFQTFVKPGDSAEAAQQRKMSLIRAQDCFDICQNLNTESTRPLVMQCLVAFELTDYHRAVNCLTRCLARFRSLEDLSVDVAAIYGSTGAFESVLDRSDIRANETQKELDYLLHGYFSWLNGDVVTAHSSLDRALEGELSEAIRANVVRFRDLIGDARPARSGASS